MITKEMINMWSRLSQTCNCDEMTFTICEVCYTQYVRTVMDKFVRTGEAGGLKSNEQVVKWLICLADRGRLSKLKIVEIIEVYGFKK